MDLKVETKKYEIVSIWYQTVEDSINLDAHGETTNTEIKSEDELFQI